MSQVSQVTAHLNELYSQHRSSNSSCKKFTDSFTIQRHKTRRNLLFVKWKMALDRSYINSERTFMTTEKAIIKTANYHSLNKQQNFFHFFRRSFLWRAFFSKTIKVFVALTIFVIFVKIEEKFFEVRTINLINWVWGKFAVWLLSV